MSQINRQIGGLFFCFLVALGIPMSTTVLMQLILLMGGASLAAQTKAASTVTAAGTVDYSTAAHTTPTLVGLASTKPATCATGEQYFASDASAGQNLYYCTSTNTWTLQTGGGGVSGLTTGTLPKASSSTLIADSHLLENADGSDNATKAITWAAAYSPTFNIAGTTTCDFSQSNLCKVAFGAGNTTLAFSGAHGSGLYLIRSCQDSVGGRFYTAMINVVGGSQPDPTAGATNCTEQRFSYDGTNLQGGAASVPGSTWHGLSIPEGTVLAGLAGSDQFYANASLHRLAFNNNNGGADVVVGAATTDTFTNKTVATASANDNSTKLASTAYVDRLSKSRGIPFTIGDPAGSALSVASTTTDYITVPFACTISAYNLVIDAGTITVKFWKVATGTAIPTSGNSISTSGVGISSGTAIHSTTLSDFTTTAVAANDIIAANITAVSTAKYLQAVLQCDTP